MANYVKINKKLSENILENFQMAVNCYASGNFFSSEYCRNSESISGHLRNKALGQTFPPLRTGTFEEIESMEIDEIWYNNWRWGFKFKNGLFSDFDSDYLLKKFKISDDHPNTFDFFSQSSSTRLKKISRVEIHY